MAEDVILKNFADRRIHLFALNPQDTLMSDLLDAIFEEVSNFYCEILRNEVKITRIDPTALRAWSETWKPINSRCPPNGGWDWTDKTKDFKKGYNKYSLDFAIWGANKTLCGLALCAISRGGDNISIFYIEGSPDKSHPLKGHIFNIIETMCLEYADATGKTNRIFIIEPAEKLVDFYNSHGYFLKKKLIFGRRKLEKGIKP